MISLNSFEIDSFLQKNGDEDYSCGVYGKWKIGRGKQPG